MPVMDDLETAALPFEGGNYEATKHANGKYTIHNVTIFTQLPKGEKGNKKVIGREWMQEAVEKSDLRYQQNKFLAPVHVHHHGGLIDDTSEAGKLRLTKVDDIMYEGEKLPAIFADLININADVFDRIKAGELTYRSVEVYDWDNPEINSLALLDTEVPFFRLEMLTVGRIKDGLQPMAFSAEERKKTPSQGYIKADKGAFVLFNFRGGNMPDDKAEDIENEDKVKKDGETAPVNTEKDPAEMPEKKVNGEMGMLLRCMQAMARKLGVSEEDITGKPAPEPLALEGGEGTPVDEKVEEKVESTQMNLSAAAVKRIASLEAKVSLTTGKLEKITADQEVDAAVTAVLKRLAPYNLGSNAKSELLRMARENGVASLKVYASAVERHGAKDPSPFIDGADVETGKGLAPEIMEFQKYGPSVVAKAMEFAATHRSLGDRVKHIPVKEWLAANMASVISLTEKRG